MMLSKFECIKRLCITTKTQELMRKYNQVVFEVDIRANKSIIKKAVESLWIGLKVHKVAIINMPEKTKRIARGGRPTQVLVSGYKKAIVTLNSLDGFTPDVVNMKHVA